MKKVLLLDASTGDDLPARNKELLADMCRQLSNEAAEYSFAAVQKLVFDISAGKVAILADGSRPLEDFDYVIFRNSVVAPDIISAASVYLDERSVPYSNGITGDGSSMGKLAQMVRYSLAGLPVPRTYCAKNKETLLELIAKQLKPPFILKDDRALRGRRNYRLGSVDEARDILSQSDRLYIAQEFIGNDGDFRVLFMGFRQPPFIFKRTRADDSTHLNNTSMGGSAQAVDAHDFPAPALQTARQAAELFGRDIVGVDIIFDNDGEHYILEANETPSIASGFAPETKIKMLGKFVQEEIGAA